MAFKSVDTVRGRNAIGGGIAGVIFSSFGFFMGSIFPPEARYTWPMLFPLVFIVVGLWLLALVTYGVLKNWTYSMELSGSCLKWSRVDLDDEEIGRLDLSEVSGITHYERSPGEGCELLAGGRASNTSEYHRLAEENELCPEGAPAAIDPAIE